MARKTLAQLIADIEATVYQNTSGEITGSSLQTLLKELTTDLYLADVGKYVASGVYSGGTLTLTYDDGSTIDIPGWKDLAFLDSGVDISDIDKLDFTGTGVSLKKTGTTLGINIDQNGVSVGNHFVGIYDELTDLNDAIGAPADHMQAIVLKPSEKYYHGVGGSWVELAPVSAFHSGYIGAYDTLQDLNAAQPSPTKNDLTIVGVADKEFYVYTGTKWDAVTHTDLPALVARMSTAETHLDELKQRTETNASDISGLSDDVTQLQGQVFHGIHIEDEDGNSFDDIKSLAVSGATATGSGGAGEVNLDISPKITVANGQQPDDTSATGNALLFPGATITPDPNDANVITVSIPAGTSGINLGDGVNASREVTTVVLRGHQAYGSGNTAEIHLEFAHFKTLAERDAWSTKFGSGMTYDTVAVVDADDNGFVAWYRFNSATKKWEEYDAQGVIMSDSNGAIPKNIKTVVYGPGFAIQQAGDQEDAALVTYTPTGDDHNHAAELTVEQDWGSGATSTKVDAIQTLYPLEVNRNNASPLEGNAALSINPSAYEAQHGHACLTKLDRITSVAGQHPHVIFMPEEVVPTGEYFSLNPQEGGIDVQDNTGGDTAATGGQATEVLAKLSFLDIAPDDGIVRMWVEYKDPSDLVAKRILEDVRGRPLAVQKHYKANDKIGDLIIAGTFMAKSTEALKIVVETSFDSNSKITLDSVNSMVCLNQFNQGYETSVARIEFLRRAALQITPAIAYIDAQVVSLTKEIKGETFNTVTITPGTGTDTLNEFGVINLTNVSVGIANDFLTVADDGSNIADYYVDCLIDNTHTRMVRHKNLTATTVIKNPNDAFRLEVYEWTGKPDQTTNVYSGRGGDGNPIINTGWNLIKSLFIPEKVNGQAGTYSIDFTATDNSSNLIVIVRPVIAQNPSKLDIAELTWGCPKPFTGYVEIERYTTREEHLRFSESYAQVGLNNQGKGELRYTINNTPSTGNPMPVGVIIKGRAPIEIDNSVNKVSSSIDPTNDGAIKFTKDGEVSLSKSYNVWNEEGTENTVTFWDVLIDVDGNESKIAESERTFRVPANTGAPGLTYTIPAYAVEVEAGQRIGGRAISNKKDGVYVQSQNVSEYIVLAHVDFKELDTKGSADDPDLVSAPLQKSLVTDRRYYEFSGNSAQNIDIANLTIPSDVKLKGVTVEKVTSTGYASASAEHAYNSSTQTLTVHVAGATEGTIFIEFWSK